MNLYGKLRGRALRPRRSGKSRLKFFLVLSFVVVMCYTCLLPSTASRTGSNALSLLAIREAFYAGEYYDRLQEYLNSEKLSSELGDKDRSPALVDLQRSLARDGQCPIYTYFQDGDEYDKTVLAKWMVHHASLGLNPVVLNLNDLRVKYAYGTSKSAQATMVRKMLRRSDLLEDDKVVYMTAMQDHMHENGLVSGLFMDYHIFALDDPRYLDVYKWASHCLQEVPGLDSSDIHSVPPGALYMETFHGSPVLLSNEENIKLALLNLQKVIRKGSKLLADLASPFEACDYSREVVKQIVPTLEDSQIGELIDSHRHYRFISELHESAYMDRTEVLAQGVVRVVDPISLPAHLLGDKIVRLAKSLATCPEMLGGLPTSSNIGISKDIDLERTWSLVQRATAKKLVRESDLKRLQRKIDSMKPACRNLKVEIVSHYDGPQEDVVSLIGVPHPLTTVNALNIDSNLHQDIMNFPYRNQFIELLFTDSSLDEKLDRFRKLVWQDSSVVAVSYELASEGKTQNVLNNMGVTLGFIVKDHNMQSTSMQSSVEVQDHSVELYVPTYKGLQQDAPTKVKYLKDKMQQAQKLVLGNHKGFIVPEDKVRAKGLQELTEELEPVTQPVGAIAESVNPFDASAWNTVRVLESINNRIVSLITKL